MSKKYASKAAVAALTAGLMALSPVVAPLGQVATALAAEASYADATTIDVSDLTNGSYEGYKVSDAEVVDADGNAVSGYAGTTVQISEAGTYRLTGTADNANVTVKKGTEGVTLVLDNLTLSCDYTAPIVAKKNTEVTIVLVGTSTITDDETMDNDGVIDDYEGSVIKAKDGSTLTIQGTGTLNVVGTCKNGIRATCNPGEEGETGEVTLNVVSGTYRISVQDDNSDASDAADGDGIHSDGTLNIGAEGMDDASLTINVEKACEGLEGGTVNIYGGTIDITTSDDGINAANKDYAKAGVSYEFNINIYGGTVNVVAGGDGIDSNGNILTAGGLITTSTSSFDNGAMDKGDGNYTWRNTGATVIAFGQAGMEEVPSEGAYVAWGASGFGGGFGGRGGFGGEFGGDFDPANLPEGFGRDGERPEPPEGFEPGQVPEGGFGGRGGFGDRGGFGQDGERPEPPEGFGGGRPDFGGGDGQLPEGFEPGQVPEGGFGGGFGGQSSVSYAQGQTLTLTASDGTVVWEGVAPVGGRSFIYASSEVAEGETYTLSVDGVAQDETATGTAGTQSGGSNPGGGQAGEGQPGEGGQQGRPDDGGQTPPAQQAETWVCEDGTWYVRYADGSTKIGWAELNGDWYFLDAANGGAMKAGWTYEGGHWYHMNEAHDGTYGKMETGWVFVDGKWYYLNEKSDGTKGAMLKNTVVDGYKLGPDGAWVG